MWDLVLKQFMPHGHCFLGNEFLLNTYSTANFLIFLSYLTISIILLTVFFIRKDFKHIKLASIYGLFILFCGIGHLIMVLNLTNGYYYLESWWHVGTAAVSIVAAFATMKIAPSLIKFPKNSLEALEQMTDQLNTIEDKFKSVFYLSSDLICVANSSYEFEKLNPAWEKELGWPLDELMEGSYLDFIHPDDIAKTKAAADGLVTTSVNGFRNRYRCKDGTYKTLEWSATTYTVAGDTYAIARLVK